MSFKLNVDEIPSVFSEEFNSRFSIRSPTNIPISPINIDFSNIVPGWIPYNERLSGFDDSNWEQEYYNEKKSYIETPMKPITLLQIAEYEKKNKSNIKKSQVISHPEKQAVVQKHNLSAPIQKNERWGEVVGKKKQNKNKFNRKEYYSDEETDKNQNDRNVNDLEDNFFDYNLLKNRNEDNSYW